MLTHPLGVYLKMWNKRMFTLSKTDSQVRLAYFKPKRANEFAHLDLDASTIVEPVDALRFKVTSVAGETFFIAASTEEERDAWVAAIKQTLA